MGEMSDNWSSRMGWVGLCFIGRHILALISMSVSQYWQRKTRIGLMRTRLAHHLGSRSNFGKVFVFCYFFSSAPCYA